MLRTRGRLSVMYWSRILGDRLLGTPFARALARARRDGRREFVFGWNRGLGDIALGLVPLFVQHPRAVPEAGSPCSRAPSSRCLSSWPTPTRSTSFPVSSATRASTSAPPRRAMGIAAAAGRDGVRRPRPDALARRATGGRFRPRCAGIPPGTRSPTGWSRPRGRRSRHRRARPFGNGPVLRLREGLAGRGVARAVRAVSGRARRALGAVRQRGGCGLRGTDVIDLRGRTDFLELLAVIRTRCRILVAPDSGVLTAPTTSPTISRSRSSRCGRTRARASSSRAARRPTPACGTSPCGSRRGRAQSLARRRCRAQSRPRCRAAACRPPPNRAQTNAH